LFIVLTVVPGPTVVLTVVPRAYCCSVVTVNTKNIVQPLTLSLKVLWLSDRGSFAGLYSQFLVVFFA